jgi:hypothetical protein
MERDQGKKLIIEKMQGRNDTKSTSKIQQLVNTSDIQLSTNTDPDNEPTVAVNPNNPLSIVAASHSYGLPNGFAQFGVYRSTNGGDTFTNSLLPIPAGFDFTSDPIIDADLQNRYLLAGIAVRIIDEVPSEASIIVYRSVDDGQTFSNAIIVSDESGNDIFDDKEYLGIDKSPASSFVGNAYISYTRFTADPDETFIMFQRSLDGGLTWLPSVTLATVDSPTVFAQGSNVQVGPNGEVYVAWIEGDFNNAIFKIRRSDDGGVTFGPTVTVSNIVRVPATLNSEVPQWGFRTPTFSFLAVDTSGCFGSAEFARVYAVWQDYRSGNAHILMSFSDNGGTTWSTPIRVDNSPENTQNFFPFVTSSPCSGNVNVIYYTNRVSTTLLDVFVAESLNGGESFTNNSRITDVSSDPNADPSFGEPSTFIGDYIFSAIMPPHLQEPEKLVSVWTDTRTGSQDIFANINEQTLTLNISCPSNITVPNEPGQCGAIVTYPEPTVTDNCPEVTVTCTPASGTFFPVGTTTVTCTATDSCGGSAQCSFTVTVNDTEPPTITCPENITQDNDLGECGAIVTYPEPTVTDNCPGVTVSCTPASGSFFPVGTTTVTCTATDAAGNTAQCLFTVTVNDTEPPTITCPDNITQDNDPGECGAVVTYPEPTVTNNCPGVTVTCTPASGSFFLVGTTTVTCTATDAAGNTAQCSFTVTVNDTEAPIVTCPNNITQGNDSGESGAIVTYPEPTVTDNCPGVTVTCTPASGSFFPIGTTTVTCTATDAAGNTAQCSFTVTVNDTEPPNGRAVIEETVVLGDFLIQTLVESEIKLPSYATDVKQIKKNVNLTQCKAVPIPGNNNVVNLFIEGSIHKNFEYVDGCEGCVKDYSVDVPFSCFNRVELSRPAVFPFGEFSVKENVRERRELAKDGMGADRCTFGSLTFEINNEPIRCKLLASAVNQLDILENFDNWGRFDKVIEKADVILAIKLTQKQAISRFLYISSTNGGADDDTIEIYNINNPNNPVRVGEFPSVTSLGPAGLAIKGTTLYVANLGDGIEIYNIANPTDPVRLGVFGEEELNVPDQLIISGNTLYVSNAGDNTVEIYNITNPTVPVHVGEFNAGNLSGPSGMSVTDTTLYVANTGDNTVEIYNISNPTDPVRVGEINEENLNVPAGLAIKGNTLYVANAGDNTIEIYNITNPTDPVRVREINGRNLSSPAVLAITGSTLYVANTGDNTVEIYSITNPTDPVRVGEFGAGDLDFPNGFAIFTSVG